MKSINQEAVLLDQTGLTPYQVIERVGRTCYQSLDKITDDSAKPFVERLFKAGHHAALEFGYVYIKITNIDLLEFLNKTASISNYIRLCGNALVGSLRAFYDWFKHMYELSVDGTPMGADLYDLILENRVNVIELTDAFSRLYPGIFFGCNSDFWDEFADDDMSVSALDPFQMDDPFIFITREGFIKYINESGYTREAKMWLIPHTVMFTTSRGITHELCRHRPGAHMMESTRYCKYDEGITVIKPMFEVGTDAYKIWQNQMHSAETAYRELRKLGESAQASRGVLPNDLKADYWMSFFEDGWQHILNLRYHGKTGAPHPQMKELMGRIYPVLKAVSEGRIQ